MDWQTKPLGEIAESVDYGVTASATQRPTGPKFLRITDIQNGSVSWQSVPWCSCGTRSASQARLKSGDIVFARTGATTGKSFLIRDCPTDAVFASYLIRLRLGDRADPSFVSHYFTTPAYWAQITKNARGVAQAGVNATTLKSIEIPLPPLTEQRRIAAILDKADALRAKRRAALAQLDMLAKSIFLDMFGDPATNPRGWDRRPLMELGVVITGKTPPSSKLGMFGDMVPFITPGDLESEGPVKRGVTDAGANESATVSPGATFICCIGATIGKIGTANARSAFNQQINAVQWGEKINWRYGFEALRFFRRAIVALGTSTTLPILKKSSFERMEIPVPPMQPQREFARQISAVEAVKATQRPSLAEMNHLFASLQHRAFRGEL